MIMFTSDVSARGMDYPDVTTVIQVGLPSDKAQYVHRLGRTARAGKQGECVLVFFVASVCVQVSFVTNARTDSWQYCCSLHICLVGRGVLLLADFESSRFLRQIQDQKVKMVPSTRKADPALFEV